MSTDPKQQGDIWSALGGLGRDLQSCPCSSRSGPFLGTGCGGARVERQRWQRMMDFLASSFKSSDLVSSMGHGGPGCRGEERRVKSVAIPVLIPCLCLQGSMYDGLADNYNNYGTTSRSSYYSKFQAGNGSWGYPVRNCFRSERPRILVGMV